MKDGEGVYGDYAPKSGHPFQGQAGHHGHVARGRSDSPRAGFEGFG